MAETRSVALPSSDDIKRTFDHLRRQFEFVLESCACDKSGRLRLKAFDALGVFARSVHESVNDAAVAVLVDISDQ